MGGKAKVYAVGALRDLRPALVKFEESCRVALLSAESDATRVLMRLRSDRLPYWTRQIREREEELTRVKSEISMKQVMRGPEHRATVDDRKAADKARARVAEAREKLDTTHRWIRVLEKEANAFSGAVQPLKGAVAAELPRAIAELDRMASALEAYLAIGAKRKAAPGSPGDGSAP
jgi:hypothetical protein